jgi:peroxiredoxin Q/BCP
MIRDRHRFVALAALTAIGGLMLFGLAARADELALGSPLPATQAPDQDGKTVDLAAAGGKGWTLVYFYPMADTPGCTKQACSLRDAYSVLTDKGVRVFGVSADSTTGQKAFQQKYKLPFTLIADTDKKVMDAFGVPHTLGVAKRQAFLFRDGKLYWRDLAAATEKQAADVLAAIAAPAS